MNDKVFGLSLAASFLVHAIVFAGLFYAQVRYPDKKLLKNIEVVYHTQVQVKEKQSNTLKVPRSVKQRQWTPQPKILTKKDPVPPAIVREMPKTHQRTPLFKMHKKQFRDGPSLYGKRQISVPLLKSEKITNPQYLNYHDRVRNKIKHRAYFYVDDPQFEAGEVYLTFVILSDGTLKKIKIINAKTHANHYLRGIGLRSIKESSPFPPFPRELKYPELSFNVVISFEVKE